MNEIWKWINGYEGKYQISNLGNVKTFNIPMHDKRYGMNLSINKYPNGYEYVQLKVNNKRKSYLVHRLVAEHFVENPNNYKVVNHLDSIRNNNNYKNLEWTTQSENILYGYKNNKNARSFQNYKRGKNHKKPISINMYDLNMNFIKNFESIRIAANYLVENNISKSINCESSIRAVVNKKQKTAYGYVWKKGEII